LSRSWKKSLNAINDLHLRERRLLAITCVSVIVIVFLFASWIPLAEAVAKKVKAHEVAQTKIDGSKAAIVALEQRAKTDVNAPYRQQIERLRDQIDDQENTIDGLTSALINPKNMRKVFRGLLQENHLSIVKVKNDDAVTVSINKEEEENHLLFKHGLSLEMRGQFLNTLKYIQELEKQDWQLYWDELEFTTLSYPNGKLEIKVHTLSTSEHVLGL